MLINVLNFVFFPLLLHFFYSLLMSSQFVDSIVARNLMLISIKISREVIIMLNSALGSSESESAVDLFKDVYWSLTDTSQNFQPRSRSIGLGLMQCWPRSHEGCPCGLVVSHQNHVITLRSSQTRNCCLLYNILLKLTFEHCIDTVVTAIEGVISWY